MRLLPPLVITEAEVDEALDRLDAALARRGERGIEDDHGPSISRCRRPTPAQAPKASRADPGQSRRGPPAAAHARRAGGPCGPLRRALHGRKIVGCAELAPLSPQVAEVRSLAVDRAARGLGRRHAARRGAAARAQARGFDKLCAFTHAPGIFHPDGLFDRAAPLAAREGLHRLREVPAVPACGQYAMVLPLDEARSRAGPRRAHRTARLARRANHAHDTHVSRNDCRRRHDPAGFRAAGVSAGIKARGGLDLRCSCPIAGHAAAVFTTNHAQAAPVLVSREHLARSGGMARAIVVNSGCANACTGDGGHGRGARAWPRPRRPRSAARPNRCSCVDRRHRRRPEHRKDRARRCPRPQRRCRPTGGPLAARAIMTTDPFPKEAAARADDRRPAGRDRRHGQGLRHDRADDGDDARLRDDGRGGAAAAARPGAARGRQRHVQRDHRGRRVLDQRLRDAAGQRRERRDGGRRALRGVRARRSRPSACGWRIGIVRGGEGATKLVTVRRPARSRGRARRAAKAIANSLLVKTAIHGGDPNWGRLIAVAGRAGVAFELSRRGGADRIDRAVQGRAAVRRRRAGGCGLSQERRGRR